MTPAVRIGYATNVHPGRTLDEALVEIDRVAPRVRERLIQAQALAPDDPLELGFWLSARAARRLRETSGGVERLAERFARSHLMVRSLNGFPYGHFHDERVKHAVYRPSWSEADRLLYTQDLAEIMADFVRASPMRAATSLDERSDAPEASVSTLPIGWRAEIAGARHGASLGVAAAHLEQLVRFLARLEDATGVRIHVDLEPEPGCFLDRAQDAIDFFGHALRPRRGDPDPKRYLGICHDVCHAAVLWESQAAVIERYRSAGLRIGRIQLSSALEARGANELAALRAFDEPRYLHQTTLRDDAGRVRFFDDLPEALAALEAPREVGASADSGPRTGAGAALTARTHLHVPLAFDRVAGVGTTRADVVECLRAWPAQEPLPAVEVETYTWSVLPSSLQPASLDEGIAAEIRWAAEALARPRGATATR